MANGDSRPRVDFLAGERNRRMDAMERVYSEIRRRVSDVVDGRELDYTIPESLRRIPTANYVSHGFYAIGEWLTRRPDSIVHINNQRLGMILHMNDFSPSIILCHDIIEHVMREYWGGWAYRNFIRAYLTGTLKADVVVTPSKWTADDIKRHFPGTSARLETIHDAVDHTVFRRVDRRIFLRQFGLPEGRRYMLYVGSEQPRKNVPAVIRAFISARKEFPNLTFLKIGRADEVSGYPVHQQILQQLAAADLSGQALFFDDVPDELMPAAYSAADAFLFPSLYEGFGLPVLEAMACGSPVVASNVTAIPEVAGDAVMLVPPNEDDAILEALSRILRDQRLREELSARGVKRASQFSWDEMARKWLDLYRQLDPRNG